MLAYLFLSCSTDTAKLPKSKCVISINLDDISVEKFQTARLTKPDKLFKSGVLFLNTQNVMLSVTLPSCASHLVGSGQKHMRLSGTDGKRISVYYHLLQRMDMMALPLQRWKDHLHGLMKSLDLYK